MSLPILSTDETTAPLVIQYMPAGRHVICATINGQPGSREVVVDAAACARLNADLAEMQRACAAGKKARPIIYFDHKQGEAAAYPKRFYWEDGKGVMLELESWSAAGRAAVEGRNYNYVSPAFRLSNEDGQVLGLIGGVEVASLVNDPAFEQISPIVDVAAHHQPAEPGVSIIGASHCNQYHHEPGCEDSNPDDDREPWERRRDEREKLEKDLSDIRWDEENARDKESMRSAGHPVKKSKPRYTGNKTREQIEARIRELDKQDAAEDTQNAKAGRNVISTTDELESPHNTPHNNDTTPTTMIDELKKLLGLDEEAGDDAICAAVADIIKDRDDNKKLAEEAQKAAEEKDEELKAARAAEKDAWLNDLKQRGVIAPQDEDAIQAASSLFDAAPAAARTAYAKMPAADDSAIIQASHPKPASGTGENIEDFISFT